MRQADDDSYDMREADEPAPSVGVTHVAQGYIGCAGPAATPAAPSAGVTHVAQDDIGCESLLKRRRAATTASMAPRAAA